MQYGISVFPCEVNCNSPGPEPVTSAARGDTVWVKHEVRLLRALEATAFGQVRPDCGENATVLTVGGVQVVSIPPPSCPDSVQPHDFVADSVITRLDQWIIDSSVAPAPYAVVGHILVRPFLQPTLLFTVQ